MTRGVGQAIGKPLDGLGVGGGRAPSHSEINWVDFNYPPVMRLIHFDMQELPSSLTSLVRCFNISFQLTTITCIVNLFSTAIIVMSTKAPHKWLLQSLLHLFLLPAASFATFYSGSRGFAEPDSQLAYRFKLAQPCLAL